MAVYTDVTEDRTRRFLHDYAVGDLLSYKGIAEGVGELQFPAAHHERLLTS